ncbi:chemotaxis protein CheB [Deinococcus sp. QL22]|uniref:chemotaxis protein CheB n=1 Tax=Deinococcus sp. QL22 TaxID=2939437 RepID=UPI002016F0EB|nr:chemotaxis protein CheB [Deinococcus sp. QL22]UQN10757.1 chemotaxis protein CheB [Deinococcus sp. QL22]UQN10803.1 chemotaxis protein CheB [Deinococcus sp. QL22]
MNGETAHSNGLPLVVIGGSAGALSGLLQLVAGLPAHFPAAVLVVVHLPPDQPSVLSELLHQAGPLPAKPAEDGEELQGGHIYVAPPNHHLLTHHSTLKLSRGPRENRSRPSIDVLFRSAAYSHGPRVAGVVLSGMQDDGTSGLWAVKQCGGTAIVQRPEEAEYPEMPLSALRQIEVDEILSVQEIAAWLSSWGDSLNASEKKDSMNEVERHRLSVELSIAKEDAGLESGILNHGPISPFTCPDCHGVMVQIKEGQLTRFRCHTGHAFTSGSLISGVRQMVEDSLWSAVRAMDEQVMLLEHLGKQLGETGQEEAAQRVQAERQQALQHRQVVRRVIFRQESLE